LKYDAEIARTLADRQEARTLASKACTDPEALRIQSTAAKTVTETEIPQIMKDSVSVRTWKARNGLDRSCR
jgi:hypothetical protein